MSEYICPRCGARSSNPTDKAEGYCGFCHAFTGPSAEDRIPMVAVYEHPQDFPGKYVARRYWVHGSVISVEADPIAVADTLDQVRSAIPPGMIRTTRMPGDDLKIVETWL